MTVRLKRLLAKVVRIVRIVTVNFLVFILVILALEISARFYSKIVKGRDFFRENTFISPWITTYDYPPPFVDENGDSYFRNRDQPTTIERTRDSIRIIAVGGSTTANKKAFRAAKIDYPGTLERLISETWSGVEVEVLNAGGDAFSTAHSLVNIGLRLVEYRPDVIILMHNINDSTVNYFSDGAKSDYSNKYMQFYFLNPALQSTLSVPGFLTQFRFFVKLGVSGFIRRQQNEINLGADFSKGLGFFRRNLATISSVCRANGIDLVVLTQPSSMEEHAFVSQEAFLSYNNAILEFGKAAGVQTVDMFSLFGHEKADFVDQFHYSPQGIEKFSEILLDELQPAISSIVAAGGQHATPDASPAQ